ncbi:hypothetical protein PPYR_10134 [Photinus pyralis]|uniref:Uncharacterized protein n=2 Tax=Photinus pyralis TaxID=7054 RepID=A0A5N4AFH0_PHOPY|nr:hypothetical protein PPYR_10134 [Photinus pyralis]
MEKGLLLCFTICAVASLDLPPYFPQCKRSDPNLNECVKNGFNGIVPKLVNGLPELGIKHVLPLKIAQLSIEEGSGHVKVTQHYQNVDILSCENIQAESVEATFGDDSFRMVLKAFSPNITLYADYDFDGFMLFLPMKGEGKATLTIKQVTIGADIVGEVVTTNGQKYAQVNTFNITLDPKDAYYEFTNLFDGDETLGRELNHIMNAQWDALFHDVKHGYEEALSEVSKSATNQIFAKVPYDILCPI